MRLTFPTFDGAKNAADVAHIALARALEIMATPRGNVQLISWDDGAALRIVAQEGFGEEFLAVFKEVTLRHPSVCGRALFLRRTIVVEDVMVDREFTPYRDVAERAAVRAVQSTPLISSGGSLVGVLSTHADRPQRPSDRQLSALETLARTAADAMVATRTNTKIVESTFNLHRSQADWLDAHGIAATAMEGDHPCFGR